MTLEEIRQLISDAGCISVVKNNEKTEWYVIPVDYMVMNHWGQWGISWEKSDFEKVEQFLTIIEKYKVPFSILLNAYKGTDNKISMIPRVYMDCEKLILITTFGEWALEESVLDTWKGKRERFDKLLPEEQRYWLELYS